MQGEIRTNIVTNQAFASDLHYWQSLLQKVRTRQAVQQIEMIYDAYVKDNGPQIDQMIVQAKITEAAKVINQDEFKDPMPMMPSMPSADPAKAPEAQQVERKVSLAEKITKTALNTGIRFNIIDNLGFDNASL